MSHSTTVPRAPTTPRPPDGRPGEAATTARRTAHVRTSPRPCGVLVAR
ncbi:hypothetical protein [Kitasatospora sp. NPDC057223]